MYSHRILPQNKALAPTFMAGGVVQGISVLPQYLTIGSTNYNPNAYFVASDANPTTGAWVSRHSASSALAISATGTQPTYGAYTPITDTAVKYAGAGGRFHVAQDAATGQINTGDYAVEIIFRHEGPYAGPTFMCGTFPLLDNGWELLMSSSSTMDFYMVFGGALTSGPSITGLVENSWNHLFFAYDRSVGAVFAINGGTPVVVNAVETNNLVAGAFTLGNRYNSLNTYTAGSSIAHFAMWDLAGNVWPGAGTNAAVIGAIAKERASKLMGIWPQKAITSAPVANTRSTASSLDKYVTASERRIFSVGPNWIRTVDRKDSTGTSVPGILIEQQSTNEYTYSQDFSNAAWTKTRCAVSSNGLAAPDGSLTADGLVADANDNTHAFEQGLTPAAGDQIHSVWLKAGAQTFARLDITVDTDVYSYFDLSTGVLGTAGPSARLLDRGIESWGNGWYRCWIRYNDVPGAHDHHIHACPADNDQTFAGNASTVDLWVWGAQHESSVGAPSSYIPTVAAAATRTKDQLQYSASGNVTAGTGAISANVLIPAQDKPSVGVIAAISNAGSATKKFQVDILASDFAHCTSVVSSVKASITGNVDIAAGVKRNVYSQWAANDVRLYVDSVSQGTRDTTCSIAASMTVIDVGQDTAGANQIGAVINDLRIYRKPLKG